MYIQRIKLYMLVTAFIIPLHQPALAQSSMLSGSVNRSVQYDSNRYAIQQPRYDPRPVTRVRSQRIGGKTVYTRGAPTYWQRHPMQKSAAIGAGVGAVGGGAAGLISGRGIVRGAAIGAGTGAGVGVIRSSQIMRRHPIVKNTATGALVGLGVGWASSRRGSTIGKTAAVGAAAGLGWGLLKNLR
jgi:hypothetical protein